MSFPPDDSSPLDSTTVATDDPTFHHFKYELVGDKIRMKQNFEGNSENRMTLQEEQSSVVDSLAEYLKQYMIKNFELEENFLPYNDAPVRCSFLLSRNYHEKEKLLLIIQSKSGSQMGIWSRSACLLLGILDGSMISLLESAKSKGYGIVIMNPNTNSSFNPDIGERTLIPHSSTPTEHVLNIWDGYIASIKDKAGKPKIQKIFILAHGNAATLAKDIVQREMVYSRNLLQPNRIAAIATVEASRVIEEDDSEDIQQFMLTKAVNFDGIESPLIKTGFIIPKDHRPSREVLGVSQSIAVQVIKIDRVPLLPVTKCITEVFDFFDVATQSTNDVTTDIGYLFAQNLARERDGPKPKRSKFNAIISTQIDDHNAPSGNYIHLLFSNLFSFTLSSSKSKAKGSGDKRRKSDGLLTIKDFKLKKVVGKGAYGKVMLVEKVKNQSSKKAFAMKILKKSYIVQCNEVEHAQAERDIMTEVNHPFIVSLHYAFQNQYHLYLVMDYCPGGSLFYHLRRVEYFDKERTTFYAASMLLVMEHLHSKNIIFRDLKLENILMDAQGFIVLSDFGLAKQNITTNQSAYTFCGTPEYLAPEIIGGFGYGKPVDWWTLGILIYEMMAGYTPFFNRNRDILVNSISNQDPVFDGRFDEDSAHLITNLLQKNPEYRLGTDIGANKIKCHHFFQSINWKNLEKREIRPPYIPDIYSANDTSYVINTLTNMKAKDSVSTVEISAPSTNLQGFTYTKTSSILESGEDL